jgi:hypothetical protein
MKIREKLMREFFDQIKNDKELGFSELVKEFVKIRSEEGFIHDQKKVIESINDKNLLFGIEGKIIFSDSKIYVLENTLKEIKVHSFEIYQVCHIEWTTHKNFFTQGEIFFSKRKIGYHSHKNESIITLLNYIKEQIYNVLKKISNEEYHQEQNLIKENKIKKELIDKKIREKEEEIIRQEEENIRHKEELEKERKIKLEENKLSIISELDKDSNNEVDLVDDENYNKILVNNQKIIIEIDKNYIQKFVKISIYLKTKRSNIQKIFDSIKKTKNDTELNELVNLLKNQIHTYDLLVFHSISMITSLVDSDLITFYQIYECFDQLGVFNSNWENEVSDKLTNIGNGIKDLMYSIYQMENKIVNSIGKLTYITQSSYNNLNLSINSQLRNINSSLDYSNYMTKIQNYKMFNIIT